MIKPTVGRVVLYYPANHGFEQLGPYGALVVYVHGDRMINVGGFDHNGKPFSACSVLLLQDGDNKPDTVSCSYAEWMPYQKGQAAKTEQLEAQLKA